jgi:hypothetical protein
MKVFILWDPVSHQAHRGCLNELDVWTDLDAAVAEADILHRGGAPMLVYEAELTVGIPAERQSGGHNEA